MNRNLTELTVIKNCPAKWRSMQGDDIVRHCTHCDRNVYNLSNMSLAEAQHLVEAAEGRLCVRFYRRPDGMLMTRDCGRAVRARTKFIAVLAPVLATFGLVIFPVLAQGKFADPEGDLLRANRSVQRLNAEIAATEDAEEKHELEEARDFHKSRAATARQWLKERVLRSKGDVVDEPRS